MIFFYAAVTFIDITHFYISLYSRVSSQRSYYLYRFWFMIRYSIKYTLETTVGLPPLVFRMLLVLFSICDTMMVYLQARRKQATHKVL